MVMEQECACAIDLGATNIRAALVLSDGTIEKKITRRTPRDGADGSIITREVIRLAEEICDPDRSCAGIGISAAGPLDIRRGCVSNSPNMAFSMIPLVEPLEERFGCEVNLRNDAAGGLLGECWVGAAQDCSNSVYITISTGIGGGAMVDGMLLSGRGGNAAEIGHIFVDSVYRVKCSCGYPGHWEAYASGAGIPRFFAAWAADKGIKSVSFDMTKAEAIFSAVRSGDRDANAFLSDLSVINARALSTVIAAFDPELIILDGAVALNHADLLIPGINEHLDHYLDPPAIVISALGGDAPLLGAACSIFGLEHTMPENR